MIKRAVVKQNTKLVAAVATATVTVATVIATIGLDRTKTSPPIEPMSISSSALSNTNSDTLIASKSIITRSEEKEWVPDGNELPSGSDSLDNADLSEPEFRLQNIKRLMATRTDRLTALEKELVIDQILTELPYLVSTGELHPFDATLAYVMANRQRNIRLSEQEVDAINEEYIASYPISVSLPSHPH